MVYFRGGHSRRYPNVKMGLMVVLNSTFASSAPSGALRSIQATLGVGQEVSILVISMYIVGYILGPIVFAPVDRFVN
jgi:MFS transporter, DHA1 family, multidrug resistance protein